MLYMGLDAGGSKTKLVARSPGKEDVTLFGPAANVRAIGNENAAIVLADLVRKALAAFPHEPFAGACAGVAGAGRPSEREQLASAWAGELGNTAPDRLLVVHDAEIAIEGAFKGGSGIIVIVGTGSIAFARSRDGGLHRVGGWGSLLGDEGSGYALGLSGLSAVGHHLDGGPATALKALVADEFGLKEPEDLIHRVYRDHLRIQDVAPLVIRAAESGDAVARGILVTQAQLLVEQVTWLVSRCPDVDSRLAFIGGLSQVSVYREVLEGAIRNRLSGWQIVEPALEPVEGALRLAMKS
jgi:glucosamine kinase